MLNRLQAKLMLFPMYMCNTVKVSGAEADGARGGAGSRAGTALEPDEPSEEHTRTHRKERGRGITHSEIRG